ncbi:MAG TPA: phosphoribosylformylglycinamidine cyclo-ligase, partial [Pelagibacteraceae bacterium]|nr:phosphoribosylformylglycinamidine cyclo-ligase [Pelagibacteraceae bacterium]
MTVYKKAGVDVLSTDKLIKKIVPLCSKTNRPGKMGKIGSFGGMFDLKMCKYKDPILVTSSDGIGTKTILGISENRLDGLGFDLVGMCLNDIICHGAEPLFFLDYFASSKVERSSFINIIKSIAAACKENNCLLIGGETAEMPGVYKNKDFDLAGFCVGAVERKKMLPRMDRIKPGDIVLGLPSSGFHSNGYSLIRKVIKEQNISLNNKPPFKSNDKNLAATLLKPTKLYYNLIVQIIKFINVKGIAHITGGGIIGNLPRIVPNKLSVKLDLNNFPKDNLFSWFKNISKLDDR